MSIPSAKLMPMCAVCGKTAFCRHFGAYSCSACAAFFRRAVAGQKSYKCPFQNSCVINPDQKKCVACRFRKCTSAGMKESEVLSLGTPRQSRSLKKSTPATVLTSLQKFDHTSNFSVYQNTWLQKILLSNQSILHQRKSVLSLSKNPLYKKCFVPDVAKYVLNEPRFCHMFLTASGIMDIAEDVVEENINNVISYWTYLTMVLNTLQYDSITNRKISLTDHSMVEMSEASIREMYATEPLFHKHLDTLVNTAMPRWYRSEELIKQIREISMTKEEQAFYMVFCMVDFITRLSPEPKVTRLLFKQLLDNVFRSMNMYYRDNFTKNCMAIRAGELIMALPLVNEMYNLFTEHRVIIIICIGLSDNFTEAALLKAFGSHRSAKK